MHRVQRVPETEAQGRIHTSTCTVAVFPEPEDVGEIEINKADLQVDTYRASGAGGQHVNKTDSAIRITHLPTGIVVECQDERSQHKNRARAMSLLQARLRDAEEHEAQSETAEQPRSLVGTGDRSERIRTYNFPQGRLTDHRINLTLYKLDDIVEGDLDDVIGAARERASRRPARRARARSNVARDARCVAAIVHGQADGSPHAIGDTVGGLVAWALASSRGRASPLLDAELLIAFVTGRPRSSVLAFPERAVAHGARRRGRAARPAARARRAARVPRARPKSSTRSRCA